MEKDKHGARQECAIFSFFAGAGFLDLGFETSGHEVVFVNEIHQPFLNAYKHARASLGLPQPRYGYHPGDMEELTKGEGHKVLHGRIAAEKKDGKIIGFIGGPPCPDFSIAGKNRGRNGKHGKLSETYTTLIRQQKPDFFLFENVKGLWKTKGHREFYEELKSGLQSSGYVTTERLVNALEYGIAQDRDRIILVGFRKELFPSTEVARSALEFFPWSTDKKYSRDTIEDIKKNRVKAKMPRPLTVSFWFDKNKVSSHPNTKHHFKPHVVEKFRTIPEGEMSGKSFKRLHRHRYSPTAAYGNNEVHLHPVETRRLSVAEALAIQSLPRKFEFPGDMTLTDMFKAVGNGVPYVAARAMAKSIRNFLDQQPQGIRYD
jgi:DNA (cytosine-5)-methyltransferase 1